MATKTTTTSRLWLGQVNANQELDPAKKKDPKDAKVPVLGRVISAMRAEEDPKPSISEFKQLCWNGQA